MNPEQNDKFRGKCSSCLKSRAIMNRKHNPDGRKLICKKCVKGNK